MILLGNRSFGDRSLGGDRGLSLGDLGLTLGGEIGLGLALGGFLGGASGSLHVGGNARLLGDALARTGLGGSLGLDRKSVV